MTVRTTMRRHEGQAVCYWNGTQGGHMWCRSGRCMRSDCRGTASAQPARKHLVAVASKVHQGSWHGGPNCRQELRLRLGKSASHLCSSATAAGHVNLRRSCTRRCYHCCNACPWRLCQPSSLSQCGTGGTCPRLGRGVPRHCDSERRSRCPPL